jgi:hypothetical protein
MIRKILFKQGNSQIHEEGARSELRALQHLAQRIVLNRHLFAAANKPMVFIVGMSHVLGPGDENA